MVNFNSHLVAITAAFLLYSVFAAFTIKEFAITISTDFTNAIQEKLNVTLPLAEVKASLSQIDIEKLSALITAQGVPYDDKAKDVLKGSLGKHATTLNVTESQLELGLYYGCVCLNIDAISELNSLDCDRITNEVASIKDATMEQMEAVFKAQGFDPANNLNIWVRMMLECNRKVADPLDMRKKHSFFWRFLRRITTRI